MDSITHTLFGIGIYKAINKENLSKKEKQALLFTAIGGSQIPDIDVISQLWDTTGQYQMWHRGITHSIFLVPVWALMFSLLNRFLFGTSMFRFFLVALLAVFIHDTSDIFNAWGTGYLEPFTSKRLTFGTVSIIDFVIWFIFLLSFIMAKKRPNLKEFKVFRIAWLLIGLHILIQSIQGYVVYQQYESQYDQVALSASFVPWKFSVIGKSQGSVEIINDSLLTEAELVTRLESSDESNLDDLFEKNPKAKTLYQWSPFVVVVDNDDQLGIYDPRFYRNGQSFLFEYMEKQDKK